MKSRIAWVLVLAVHVALVSYFFADELPLRDVPMLHGDFPTHAAQAKRVLQGVQTAGRTWVYDPQLLAGAPNGVLFDADNKGWELWTVAWVSLGAPLWWAFNAFVLMVHLLMPLVIYAAARLFGLDARQATAGMTAAILLWFFDSFTHWMWFVGTVSYALVGYLALLALALLYRWTERREPWAAGACAVVLALAHLVHPYVFFVLVVPMVALWVRAGFVEKTFRVRDHVTIVGIAALTVLANGWWLWTAWQFAPYIEDSAYFGQGGVELLLYEVLALVYRVDVQGLLAPQTSIRLGLALLGGVTLLRWRRTGARQGLPLATLVCTMAVFAYLGAYTPMRQVQPFRHALPMGFGLAIAAGAAVPELVRARPWAGLRPGQRVVGLVLAAVAAVNVAGDVLYFFGGSMAMGQVLAGGKPVVMSTTGHAFAPGFRYVRVGDFEGLTRTVESRDDGLRWLVEKDEVGEGLMARTDVQVLGGFLFRNLSHADANWFRTAPPAPPYDVAAFTRYLQTYAVGWIVVEREEMSPWWDQFPKLWVRDRLTDRQVIYRVVRPTRLLDGPGTVETSVNRIEVRGTDPARDVLLRFHWMETLRCRPDCAIERASVPGDSVGFMRIPAGHPADFVVEHHYP